MTIITKYSGTLDITEPSFSFNEYIELVFGSEIIQLKKPTPGDTITKTFRMENNISINQDIHQTRVRTQRLITVFNIAIDILHNLDIAPFIKASWGEQLTYTDYFGRVFTVILTNPDEVLSHLRQCKYAIPLALEVVS